ncbi:hypothetical protein ACFL4C_01685 [Candidatus Omnitrophota bacterium]
MVFQQQTSWGWKVALCLFLEGVGAGAFLFYFILIAMGRFVEMAGVGMFVGTLATP